MLTRADVGEQAQDVVDVGVLEVEIDAAAGETTFPLLSGDRR